MNAGAFMGRKRLFSFFVQLCTGIQVRRDILGMSPITNRGQGSGHYLRLYKIVLFRPQSVEKASFAGSFFLVVRCDLKQRDLPV